VDTYNSNSDGSGSGSGSVTGSVTGSGSGSISCLPCDVTHEDQIQQLFQERIPSLLETLNGDSGSDSGSNSNNQRVALDAMVHSVAYAPASAMKNASASLSVDDDDDDDETDKQLSLSLLNTSREDFNTAHAISAHSLITMSKYALPLLSCQYDHDHDDESDDHDDDGVGIRSPSITTLSYLGATRAVSNYNIMGPAKASLESIVRGLAFELSPPPHRIRVNAVSAGPVNTLAARGIKDFGILRSQVEGRSMLRRSVTGEEVGNVVEFVASGKASGITGQVLFCDGGYSSVG